MKPEPTPLDHVPEDNPVSLLWRRKVECERMLWAHVRLGKGCEVASHSHPNEQIAFLISGHVRWRLGEPDTADYREVEVVGPSVLPLPGGFPHGIVALEDSVIVDVLSPPGPMGIDSQK
jgi:quercetin dioxygenase-like cupin family protein